MLADRLGVEFKEGQTVVIDKDSLPGNLCLGTIVSLERTEIISKGKTATTNLVIRCEFPLELPAQVPQIANVVVVMDPPPDYKPEKKKGSTLIV